MMEKGSFVPEAGIARARGFGRLPFGFGPRFFIALLIGLVWLIPATWAAQWIAAMFIWDGLVVAIWLIDLRALPSPRQLEIRRVWNSVPSLGVAATIQLELLNAGRIAVRARILDEAPSSLRLAPPALEATVGARRSATASYSILPAERGDAKIGRTFIRYQSAMRMAERRAIADTGQVVRVLPNIELARQHTMFLIRSRQVEFEKRRRRERGLGREFDCLREYREGDEMRDIAWLATARRQKLVTRVFQIERSQAVWLVLDAGRLLRAQVRSPGTLQYSKLDHGVNASLSLAQVALHCGDQVGLLAYGRRIQQKVNTGRGPQHIRAIVDSLAQVRGEANEANHGLAVHTLLAAQRRRSLIVWITDFAETATVPEVIEYALRLTPRHLVMFAAMGQPDLTALAQTTPDSPEEMYRHVAAREIMERRDLLLRSLRERGVLALELMPQMLASMLVNRYLEVKDRSLI